MRSITLKLIPSPSYSVHPPCHFNRSMIHMFYFVQSDPIYATEPIIMRLWQWYFIDT